MEKDLLAVSLDNAAVLLDLKRRTVENLVRIGELPSIRVGGRRLIRRKDLDKFLASDHPRVLGSGRGRGRRPAADAPEAVGACAPETNE